ncbi:MAG: outer membrane beta-barrel protein [Bacteroidaceae bacterium]
MKRTAFIIAGLVGCVAVTTAQTNRVSTVVLSGETGEPVSGASVVVTGSNIATTTDMNGQFTIDAPAEYQTLTVSYPNMQPSVVSILPDPIVMKRSRRTFSASSASSRWGVELGLIRSTVKIGVPDSEGEAADFARNSMLMGGVTYDYPIQKVPNLSVMGGLFFTSKGYKYDGVYDDEVVRSNYLELQATAKYSYPLPFANRDLHVFALAGPYIACGLFGSELEEIGIASDYKDVTVFDFCKRIDAGLVLGFGAEYKRFSLTCRWGIGLVNIIDAEKCIDLDKKADYEYYKNKYNWTWNEFLKEYGDDYDPKDYDGFSFKNRSFMLTLGYRF